MLFAIFTASLYKTGVAAIANKATRVTFHKLSNRHHKSRSCILGFLDGISELFLLQRTCCSSPATSSRQRRIQVMLNDVEVST
jgi:hypothetical protein